MTHPTPRGRFTGPLLSTLGGLLLGAGLMYLVPPEPVAAETTDRSDKFVLFTAPVDITNTAEAIFILDTVNGTLTGGVLGGNGNFAVTYFRDVASDFGQRQANAQYAVVSGRLALQGGASNGVIYIAENTSGRVQAYGMPGGNRGRLPLQPITFFQFRQPIQ